MISVPIGKVHPWFLVGDFPVLTLVVYMVVADAWLWRHGPRNRAWALTLGLAPLVVFIYPHGTLVHLGLVSPPHLYSFGFLAMALVMSSSLINEAAQSAVLAREVQANERRWRTLLDQVALLVAGCDRDGRFNYLNPFMLKTTGYKEHELLGKEIGAVVSPADAAAFEEEFRRAMENGITAPVYEARVRTRAGDDRVVVWSSVILHDADESSAGILSVGSDITERRAAERSRDDALKAVQDMRTRLERDNTVLKLELEAVSDSKDIVGQSEAIRYVTYKVREVAPTVATVLIEGETGVGKELVARSIHYHSPRSGFPFVCVNCAALPAPLVESELFGHEKGAFTSADRDRKGRFELAEGGTLFLDEVGELSQETQAKLLRVIQTGEYQRLGASGTRKANVRLVAATNRVLKKDVAAGRFREDLFYRLNVYPISVPPLRVRREDIPALVYHFTHWLATRYGKTISDVPASLMDRLVQLDWPGNVRELENLIERSVIMSKTHTLAWPGDPIPALQESPVAAQGALTTLAKMESGYIEQVLASTRWRISGQGGAAEILGLHPNTLRFRMTKLGITRADGTAGTPRST